MTQVQTPAWMSAPEVGTAAAAPAWMSAPEVGHGFDQGAWDAQHPVDAAMRERRNAERERQFADATAPTIGPPSPGTMPTGIGSIRAVEPDSWVMRNIQTPLANAAVGALGTAERHIHQIGQFDPMFGAAHRAALAADAQGAPLTTAIVAPGETRTFLQGNDTAEGKVADLARFAGGVVGGAPDPVNIAAMAVVGPAGRVAGKALGPTVEAMIAGVTPKIGAPLAGVAGRLAMRAIEGAGGGAGYGATAHVGQVAVEDPKRLISDPAGVIAEAIQAAGQGAEVGAIGGGLVGAAGEAFKRGEPAAVAQEPTRPATAAPETPVVEPTPSTTEAPPVEPVPATATTPPPKAPETPPIGRPDLANPGETMPVRDLVDNVDAARNAAGEPVARPRSVMRAEADKALASDFNGTVDALVEKAKAGKVFDELDTHVGARALNQIAGDAIATGDPLSYQRAVEVTMAYRKGRGETARALGAGVDPLMTPAERMRTLTTQTLTEPSPQTARAVKGLDEQIAAANPEQAAKLTARRQKVVGREAERLARITERVKAAGLDPSVLSDERITDPATFAQFNRVVTAAQASLGQKAQEWWRNSILSMPLTHMVNSTSNLAYGVFEKGLKEPLGATINLALRDPHSPQFGDYAAYTRAIGPALSRAASNMLRAWRTEMPVLESDIQQAGGEAPFGATKLESRGVAIGGKVGRVVRAPQRALVAEDELFKGFWSTLEATAEARRLAKSEGLSGEKMGSRMDDLLSDYASPAWASGVSEAERLTFQRPLGKVGQAVTSARDNIPLAYYVAPFIKTPTNIFKAGLSNSPLNILKMGWRAARAGKNLIWDDGWTYSKSQINRDLLDTTVGMTVAYGLWNYLGPDKDGMPRITGSTPTEPGERETGNRAAPPTSIRIGGKWYDYGRVEPFATALSTTVDGVNAIRRAASGEEYGKSAADFAGTFKRQVKDKTFLKTIGDLIDLIESDDPKGTKLARFAEGFATSWVPNVARGAARASDPNVREGRIGGQTVSDVASNTLTRAGQQALPIPADAPPPKVDLWGRDVQKDSLGSPATDFVYRMLSPVQTKDAGNVNQLDRLILNWNNKHPEESWYPRQPPRRVAGKIAGEDYAFDMSDQEYHDYLKRSGERAAAVLADQKLNADAPMKRDITLIGNVLDRSHEIERNQMLIKHQAEVLERVRGQRARREQRTPSLPPDRQPGPPATTTSPESAPQPLPR